MTPGGSLCGRIFAVGRGAQLLAHRVGGGVLIVSVGVYTVVTCDIGHGQVPDFGDLETGAVSWSPVRAATPSFDEMLYTLDLGLVRPRAWGWSKWTTAGRGHARRSRGRVVVWVPGRAHSLLAQQQENDPRNSSTITMARRGSPVRIGDTLIHRPPL